MGGGGKLGHGLIAGVGELFGYRRTWMADTKLALEDELRSRGIEPQVPPSADAPQAPSDQSPRSRGAVWMRVLFGVVFVSVWAWLIWKMS